MTRNFMDMLQARRDKGLFLCVGLDPDKLPDMFTGSLKPKDERTENILTLFCQDIISETTEYAAAFKFNHAFFLKYGDVGWRAMRRIVGFANRIAPQVPMIADAKYGDIGKTNEKYTAGVFEDLHADAVTLHPYTGLEAMRPFLDYKDKGCIVLAKTSNKGSGQFQNLALANGDPLWLKVAKTVRDDWNYNGNCGLVFGATYPEDMTVAREAIGSEMLFLIPGLGTQGGDLAASVRAAGINAIFNVSSGLYTTGDDFSEVARQRAKQYCNDIRAAMEG